MQNKVLKITITKMEFKTRLVLFITAAYVLSASTNAAPSSTSYAGDSGAFASAGDYDGGTFAAAGPNGAQPGNTGLRTTNSGTGAGASSSGLLLSRSGGSGHSQSKMQSVVVGSNGDATILQQNGDQPAKVYKIPGSG